MKCRVTLALALFICLAGCAQRPLPPAAPTLAELNLPPPPQVRWFPIYARFAPDGTWAVVNLCSYYNPLYCRLVRWEPGGAPQSLQDGTPSTGRWSLIAGQDADKSYIWPSVSWNGQKLAYVVAPCAAPAPPRPAPPRPSGDAVPPPHPHEAFDCEFFGGQPAISASTSDLRQGQQIAPFTSAARPAWRPDDQAILYWRTKSTYQLSSGRVGGLRDVYEYDFKAQAETPKFDLAATGILWGAEASGPFYAPDGKSFALCGSGEISSVAEKLGLQYGFQCIQVNSQRVADTKGLNPRTDNPVIDWVVQDWQGTHWVSCGDQVRMVDKKTLQITDELLNTRLANGERSNLSPQTVTVSAVGNAIIVSWTLYRLLQPIRRGTFASVVSNRAPPAPHLVYYSKQTRTTQPVFWPNVDQLQ
jgi:hypothetical protein